MSVKVNALDHLVINVADVARSAEWYRKILGMEVRVFDPGPGKTPRTSLMFGNQKINVRPRDADKVEWFTADHETAGSDDLCFLTASTPDEVVAHLKANGVAIEEGPVAKQGARGTLRSVYCRDPDGSLIEISSYEDGTWLTLTPVIAEHARSIHVVAATAAGLPSLRRMTRKAATPDLPIAPSDGRTTPKQDKAAARLHGRIDDAVHRQRRAWSDRSPASTCRGCCGCAPRAAAIIRS